MKKIYGLIVLIFCSTALAASFPNYYCPTTYKTIRVGDSLESVQNNCGVPTSTNTRQIQVSTPVTTTKWIYTLGAISVKGVGFFLPQLIITFDANNNVSDITRGGGTPVSITGNCALNSLVKIGDSMNSVLSMCGRPNYVNSNQTASTATKDVLQWTYNFGPYQPKIILSFEDNILTDISSGQLGN